MVMDTARLPLPGCHNRSNLVCAVADRAGSVRGWTQRRRAGHAAMFQPLPNRLQPAGERDDPVRQRFDQHYRRCHAGGAGVLYRDRRWRCWSAGMIAACRDAFCYAMRTQAPRAIVTMGQNGPRIHALLELPLLRAVSCWRPRAISPMRWGRRVALPDGGVILLSPRCPQLRCLQGLRGTRPPFRRAKPASIQREFPALPAWASPDRSGVHCGAFLPEDFAMRRTLLAIALLLCTAPALAEMGARSVD